MDMAQLLKASANVAQAATLAKRTTADVIRQVPIAAMGAAVLLGALAGYLAGRRQRGG
jgi:ElaB/YqjD/DUF883 family membrane-anchored ribosome-binding protein